jgi:L-aminopeptidase/D-esterase-like protein
MTSIARICFALILLFLALVVSSFAQVKSNSNGDIAYHSGANDAITDVPGVVVGHFTYNKGETHRGTTVILFGPEGALCASEVRCGNPFTIDTDAFNPTTMALECDAIVLTGGSAFGAAAEVGAINYLFDHGRGVHTRAGLVPIVRLKRRRRSRPRHHQGHERRR